MENINHYCFPLPLYLVFYIFFFTVNINNAPFVGHDKHKLIQDISCLKITIILVRQNCPHDSLSSRPTWWLFSYSMDMSFCQYKNNCLLHCFSLQPSRLLMCFSGLLLPKSVVWRKISCHPRCFLQFYLGLYTLIVAKFSFMAFSCRTISS